MTNAIAATLSSTSSTALQTHRAPRNKQFAAEPTRQPAETIATISPAATEALASTSEARASSAEAAHQEVRTDSQAQALSARQEATKRAYGV